MARTFARRLLLALVGLALGQTVRADAPKPVDIKNGVAHGELGRQLDEHVTKLADRGFAGVVLVIQKGG